MTPAVITHWLGIRSIAIAPEQIAVREGLRSGVAVAAVMCLAWYTNTPLLAWAAFSAFWTCLLDPGGLRPTRIRALLTFAVAGTLISGGVSIVAGWGNLPATFAGVGVCIFLCGLARSRGPIATQISVLSAIVVVVAVCYPSTPVAGLKIAALFVAGSLWAMLICLFAWPVDPYMPQRLMCAAIFREQAGMAGRLVATEGVVGDIGAWRRDIRQRIEQTRIAVERFSSDMSSRQTAMALAPSVDAADRILVALIAFEHHADRTTQEAVDARIIRIVVAALKRVAQELERSQPSATALERYIRSLKRHGERDDTLFTRGASWIADALTDLQECWRVRTVEDGSELSSALTASMRQDRGALIRHALRLTVGVLIVLGITIKFHLPYAYWAMMAVVVVVQPGRNATMSRTIERVAGSIAGGILAAISGTIFPEWLILLLIFPLSMATIALRSVNYTLCVLFMTQLFVLVTDLVGSDVGWIVGLTRAGNNVIGSIVGLAVCLLFLPEKRSASLPDLVVKAFLANMRYVMLAESGSSDASDIEQARRDAGMTSGQAEIQCQQSSFEGLRQSERLTLCSRILVLLRRQAGVASVISLMGGEQTGRKSVDSDAFNLFPTDSSLETLRSMLCFLENRRSL